MRGSGSFDQLIHDLHYAGRTLGKNPGFATLTVLILALGIGANTAVFSVVHAVLLKPLPFHDPDRLVLIWEDASRIGFPRGTPAPANYADWSPEPDVRADRGRLCADHEPDGRGQAAVVVDGDTA